MTQTCHQTPEVLLPNMNNTSAPPSTQPQYTHPRATPVHQPSVSIMSRSMKQDAIEAVMLSKEDFDRYTPDDPTADDDDVTANGVHRRSRLRNILVTHGDVDNGDLDMCENEDDSTIIQDFKLLKVKKLKSLANCKSFTQVHDTIMVIFKQWHEMVRGQTRLSENLLYAKTPLQLIIRVCHLIDYGDVYERGAAQNMPSNTKELVAVKQRARRLTVLRHDRNFCLGVEFLRTVNMQCNNLDCKCRMNYIDLVGVLALEKKTLGKKHLSKKEHKRAKIFHKRHRSRTVSENDNQENNERQNVQQQGTQQQGTQQHGNQQQGVQQPGAQQPGAQQQSFEQEVETQGIFQYQEMSATQSSENKSIRGKKRSRSEIASDSGGDGKYTQCERDSNQPKQVEMEQEHNQSSEDSQRESSVQDQVEEGNAQRQQQQPHQQEDSDEVEEVQVVEVQGKEEVKKENPSVIDIVDTDDVQLVGVRMKDDVKIEKARRSDNVGSEDAASIDSEFSRKKRRLLELDAECQSRLVELERIILERRRIELEMKKIDASEERHARRFKLLQMKLDLEQKREIRDQQKERVTYSMLSKVVLKLERGAEQSNSDGLVKFETSTFSDTSDGAPDDGPTVGSNEDQSPDENNNNSPETN